MTGRQWLFTAAYWLYVRWHDRRAWRRLREQPFATLEQTIALSWVTMMYARYGEGRRGDEQLEKLYTKWHFGVWPRQLPTALRPVASRTR